MVQTPNILNQGERKVDHKNKYKMNGLTFDGLLTKSLKNICVRLRNGSQMVFLCLAMSRVIVNGTINNS